MDSTDVDYLRSLIVLRDDAENMPSPWYMKGYFQGRIEEYCRQNAITAADVPLLDLGLDDDA